MNTQYYDSKYTGFKPFKNRSTINNRQKATSLTSKWLMATSAAFVLFFGFFLASFFIAISMILIPFAAFRLWWFNRKIQKQMGAMHPPGATDDIIEAEYTVVTEEWQRKKRNPY